MVMIPIDEIDHKDVKSGPDIGILAKEIKKTGLLSPLVVEKVEGGYRILHGMDRFSTCVFLGMKTIRCEVRNASK